MLEMVTKCDKKVVLVWLLNELRALCRQKAQAEHETLLVSEGDIELTDHLVDVEL